MKIIKKIILGIIIIFVALVMVGFLVPDNSNYTKGTETILSGLVANISKDSRVGIGNIYVSDYTNEAGVKKHGPVVSLEFHNLNNNPENKKILAYEGQIVNFGEQTIEIVKIDTGWFLFKASVSIRILTRKEALLADADLLYSSRFWGGLCGNDKGEGGGCYTNFYLYNSGELIKDEGFVTSLTNIEEIVTTKKQTSQNFIDEIKNQINKSNILIKDCAPITIYDAGWDYQISINGEKKLFTNSPLECRNIFDEIDNLLNGQLKNASSTISKIVDNNSTSDLENVKFIYATDNGSLPPEYHRKTVLTIFMPSSTGSIIAESVTSDYKNVLETESINITHDQFKEIMTNAMGVTQTNNKDLDGCTGGTSQSIEIYRNGNIVLQASNYNCANQSTNRDLEYFSKQLQQIISQNNQNL